MFLLDILSIIGLLSIVFCEISPYYDKNDIMIETNISVSSDGYFILPIEIGDSKTEYTFIIDTHDHFTWISSQNIYNTPKDTSQLLYYYDSTVLPAEITMKEQAIYPQGKVSGQTNLDTFHFLTHSFDQYFIMVTTSQIEMGKQYNGVLGFGKTMSPRRHSPSFVKSLEKKHIVSKKVYSFKYNHTNLNNSKLYIGGFHKDFVEEKGSLGTCLVKTVWTWQCDISRAFIGNPSQKARYDVDLSVEINSAVLFETWSNKMIVPLKFLRMFKHNLPSNCDVINLEIGAYIECYESFTRMPDLYFILFNIVVRIPKEALFTKAKRSNSYIMQITFAMNATNIILGMPFMKVYHTLFDDYSSNMWFHNENEGYIIKLKDLPEDAINTEIKTSSTYDWLVVVVIIGIFLLTTIIICYCL